ncbi:MAG: flagellar export chaperone FliS [Phycisphaerales bacterium]
MTDTKTANAYLKTRVMTASPEELRLLLLDGSIKFAYQARTGLQRRDHEMTYLGFSQCRDIVLELLNTIRVEPAPEIARAVQELYTFMYGELVKASIDKDIARLDEVIELLEYERETWVMAIERAADEREAGMATALGSGTGTGPERKPISFQA